MEKLPIHIKFNNQQNPNSEFDILQLEDLFKREDLDNSIRELQIVEFYMIVLVQQDSGKHTIDFTDYDYQKGTLLTIRKDQIHKFHVNENVKGNLLLFTDNFLVTYLEEIENQKTIQLFNELLGNPKIQLTEKELNDINEIILKIQNEYLSISDSYSLSIIRSLLHILITQLYRIKSKNNQIVKNKKYLNDFILLQKLVEKSVIKHSKVNYYAQEMAISTKTLNTITKSIVNQSAKKFIDNIYIKQIKRLLLNTEYPIKKVAYLSGFEESTNFYKYFKRKTNLSPDLFRSKNK
ncbi:AraC family transcriptional regulator [Tenacibaculum halocynthiae]|uniref:AraC family transcriptional regulator n=1 Tax=Tenacibaculum halocynthiae TaxID=1254437 RepID=UPI00262A80B0|nr:helix-turn-helix transcriptional regulator [uncultured Tenacibaculum sp.]